MKIFPGGSFLQITQGVGTPTRPNSGSALSSGETAARQFADQLLGAGRIQHTGQVRQAGPARQIVETTQVDRPHTEAPPRNLPRGSFINIRV